ncbi:hypothetical protein HBI24_138420 [Parastagonospora nodorum]|nr:hypothetical protein HBH52_019150 [Parastagonospora nodorum]KAH3998268.1 hypothetical protein HBI10_132030 [Parastagonospora nodorum]KAH4029999.1 hypothetical protein HBI13_035570 [Parastagonospora nodorum]KAH4076417.1 hypothetical protein HBH50_005500 [Parastagonospora nodorum]KAH4096103.1 hypothetical protein HBH48_052320 [Parastagonospora nodorum]
MGRRDGKLGVFDARWVRVYCDPVALPPKDLSKPRSRLRFYFHSGVVRTAIASKHSSLFLLMLPSRVPPTALACSVPASIA